MTAIRFTFSARKALEAILFLAGSRREGLDRHGILKLLFFADAIHLNSYGRPITGDQYRALPYGPVAQGAYDILKGDALALEELEEDPLPLIQVGRYTVRAARPCNRAVLSRSDCAALQAALDRFGALDFRARTDRSHEHPAYIRAIEAGEWLMRYEDFLDAGDGDAERAEDLAELGQLARL